MNTTYSLPLGAYLPLQAAFSTRIDENLARLYAYAGPDSEVLIDEQEHEFSGTESVHQFAPLRVPEAVIYK